ncbi:MAG: glycosyltransferase [Burkholderiaceae bacterium]
MKRAFIQQVAVIVPAHNEVAHIAACLAAVGKAAQRAVHLQCRVTTYVVCDSCTDRTAAVVEAAGCAALIVNARSVGAARAWGASAALDAGADWLAFTDADTLVTEDWIVAQLALQCDVVCGTIAVEDWSMHGHAVRREFANTYQDSDGHRHIHGANLGMSAAAYRSAGGFAVLTSSEDVAIVEALERAGATIAWSAAPRVVTSARIDHRAPKGFGATLLAMGERTHLPPATPLAAN